MTSGRTLRFFCPRGCKEDVYEVTIYKDAPVKGVKGKKAIRVLHTFISGGIFVLWRNLHPHSPPRTWKDML